MQIQHNIQAINSARNLAINNSALNKNLEKLSSGYKINRAGDNAAGLAISEQMRAQINGLDQAAENANDAIGMIQTAEGALTEVHSMLQRLVTLTTEAANGTMNDTSWGNVQVEVDALVAEIDRIAVNTDFNGSKPLTDGELTFQIGPSSAETITVETVDMSSAGLGIDGLKASSLGDANDSMDLVNAAINTVSSYRASLGAVQNRLEHTVNSLKVTSENVQSAESRIRDTNMADEITAFTKNNVLLQAAQSMLAQSNSVPQGILSLLK